MPIRGTGRPCLNSCYAKEEDEKRGKKQRALKKSIKKEKKQKHKMKKGKQR